MQTHAAVLAQQLPNLEHPLASMISSIVLRNPQATCDVRCGPVTTASRSTAGSTARSSNRVAGQAAGRRAAASAASQSNPCPYPDEEKKAQPHSAAFSCAQAKPPTWPIPRQCARPQAPGPLPPIGPQPQTRHQGRGCSENTGRRAFSSSMSSSQDAEMPIHSCRKYKLNELSHLAPAGGSRCNRSRKKVARPPRWPPVCSRTTPESQSTAQRESERERERENNKTEREREKKKKQARCLYICVCDVRRYIACCINILDVDTCVYIHSIRRTQRSRILV